LHELQQLTAVGQPDNGFPVVFCLVSQKSAVLKKVRGLLPNFALTQVIADFEQTATAAVRVVFGSDVLVFVSGCWLHYFQQ